MGYGKEFDAKALKELKPGSLFTEPAGQPHFSQTTDEPVVILVTGLWAKRHEVRHAVGQESLAAASQVLRLASQVSR